MSSLIINNPNEIAKPLSTNFSTLSPIDVRQKIYIEEGEIINLDTFKIIPSPYPHLRVHVHKKIFNDGILINEVCVGVYEIDEVKIYIKWEAPYNSEVISYHQVYSSTIGPYSEYNPSKHKNIIYYCNDASGIYKGKIYLNGEKYGGSDIVTSKTFTASDANKAADAKAVGEEISKLDNKITNNSKSITSNSNNIGDLSQLNSELLPENIRGNLVSVINYILNQKISDKSFVEIYLSTESENIDINDLNNKLIEVYYGDGYYGDTPQYSKRLSIVNGKAYCSIEIPQGKHYKIEFPVLVNCTNPSSAEGIIRNNYIRIDRSYLDMKYSANELVTITINNSSLEGGVWANRDIYFKIDGEEYGDPYKTDEKGQWQINVENGKKYWIKVDQSISISINDEETKNYTLNGRNEVSFVSQSNERNINFVYSISNYGLLLVRFNENNEEECYTWEKWKNAGYDLSEAVFFKIVTDNLVKYGSTFYLKISDITDRYWINNKRQLANKPYKEFVGFSISDNANITDSWKPLIYNSVKSNNAMIKAYYNDDGTTPGYEFPAVMFANTQVYERGNNVYRGHILTYGAYSEFYKYKYLIQTILSNIVEKVENVENVDTLINGLLTNDYNNTPWCLGHHGGNSLNYRGCYISNTSTNTVNSLTNVTEYTSSNVPVFVFYYLTT